MCKDRIAHKDFYHILFENYAKHPPCVIFPAEPVRHDRNREKFLRQIFVILLP